MFGIRNCHMSSHHFVKEGQEPALVIAEVIARPSVELLLEWAPQVIVLERALEQVLTWGIKVDVVIASIANNEQVIEKLFDQMPVKILSHQPDEDPLDTVFYYLLS